MPRISQSSLQEFRVSLLHRLKKLRHMPVEEIVARVADHRRVQRERRVYEQTSKQGTTRPGTPCPAALAPRAAQLLPGNLAGQFAAAPARFADLLCGMARRTRSQADRLMAGPVPLIGHVVDLSGPVDWHRDPLSEYRWPRSFYADIALYDLPGRIDVKYVWEVSRHQFLVSLGRAWRISGHTPYAARARELILDWIAQNPPQEGVHWTSSLELAVRVISWLWTIAPLADWDGWRTEDWRRIALCLEAHAEYLAGHLSFYSSPYNHLIGEATALLLLGLWLAGHPQADSWQRVARQVLSKHARLQFHSDGFCVEQAVGYHFFTLGFLAQAVHWARRSGVPLEPVEEVLPGAFEAAGAFQQPDGNWPAIGDIDSARSIPTSHDAFWDFRGMCSLGAVLCNRPMLKTVAREPGEELVWLLGCEGLRQWDSLPAVPPRLTVVLPESGYAIARSGSDDKVDWLLFDAGPLAAGLHEDSTPSVAHGHADILGLLFFQHGHPVLVDGGMPHYNGDRKWVDYFRDAEAHNTLRIEGAPPAMHAGRLAWSEICQPPRLDANLSRDVWLLRGQLSLRGGVRVERNILGLPDAGIWIADLIRSPRPRGVQWFWQFPADCCPRLNGNGRRRRVVYDGGMLEVWSDGGPLTAELTTASPASPVAWQAPEYGVICPGHRVLISATEATSLLTLTYVGPANVPGTVRVADQRLSWSVKKAADCDAPEFDQEADVIWQLDLPAGRLIIAAGCSAPARNGNWSRLVGEGGWPAARLTP